MNEYNQDSRKQTTCLYLQTIITSCAHSIGIPMSQRGSQPCSSSLLLRTFISPVLHTFTSPRLRTFTSSYQSLPPHHRSHIQAHFPQYTLVQLFLLLALALLALGSSLGLCLRGICIFLRVRNVCFTNDFHSMHGCV
jgi:hypothetical protein